LSEIFIQIGSLVTFSKSYARKQKWMSFFSEHSVVLEMTSKGHWQCHASLDYFDFLSMTRQVAYAYFSDKIAEVTLTVY